MPRSKRDSSQSLQASITRHAGTEANRRYLRSLPVFSVDTELPKEICDMLKQLEHVKPSPNGRICGVSASARKSESIFDQP